MKKEESKIVIPEGHTLKTRRDFLSHGFITALSGFAAPGVLSFLSNRAYGADCAINEIVQGKTPVFILDLAGGANIPGSNVMVGGPGGQTDYLQTYKSLGLPDDMNPKNNNSFINEEFGLKFHSDSAFLRGMLSTTNTTIRSKVDGGIFCSSSSDDTQNNPLNPTYWLYKAGAQGSLANLAGTRDSDSGGRSIVPMSSLNPQERPVSINRPEDALNLVNLGRINDIFNRDQAQRLLRSIERMSKRKLEKFNSLSLSDQIKNLVECGYIKSQDVLNQFSPDAVNAALDSDVQQVFGTLNTGVKRQTATMAKLLLDGYVGVATVSKGGYDYHNKTRSTGENRDFEVGEIIGQIFSLAARKRKNIMVYVLTDGGVAAREDIDNSNDGRGKYTWTGDSGQRSSAFMMIYRDSARPELRTGRRQIGHFKESGGVENSAMVTSNSSVNLAKAIVANYLSLHGEEADLSKIVGDNPFGADLDKYILMNRL